MVSHCRLTPPPHTFTFPYSRLFPSIPLVWSVSGLVGYIWGSSSPLHSFASPIRYLPFSLFSSSFYRFVLRRTLAGSTPPSPANWQRLRRLRTPIYRAFCPAPCVRPHPPLHSIYLWQPSAEQEMKLDCLCLNPIAHFVYPIEPFLVHSHPLPML